ncbi:hypothetical protein [Mesorhizobium sp. SP-1A]|uniref:hypothetical protein n=1 Tax=Mesorhizobium sp. SP-1A TaxID=3077840 RepID=UPI0028F6EF40|nr:hypothetical protein [Mesorhizobium sp. SP-1A]
MIERLDSLNQVCCDTCPASYPNTYADEDFAVMISDAKTAGWLVRPGRPDPFVKDTSGLFGAAPRVAGGAKPQRFTHTCPSCARPAQDGETLFNRSH